MKLRQSLLRFWNLWPPFFFSGIKVVKKSNDYRQMTARLKLRFWNANYVGTQYGGLLFSLADPFYMVMLLKNLGPQYTVWDKASTIRYLKPGKTDVFAEFYLTEEDLETIRKTVQEQGKMDWNRLVEIKDKNGEVVADVNKIIQIKQKIKNVY